MSVNDTSRIVIDDSRVTLLNVVSLIDDHVGVLYDCNMLINMFKDMNKWPKWGGGMHNLILFLVYGKY